MYSKSLDVPLVYSAALSVFRWPWLSRSRLGGFNRVSIPWPVEQVPEVCDDATEDSSSSPTAPADSSSTEVVYRVDFFPLAVFRWPWLSRSRLRDFDRVPIPCPDGQVPEVCDDATEDSSSSPTGPADSSSTEGVYGVDFFPYILPCLKPTSSIAFFFSFYAIQPVVDCCIMYKPAPFSTIVSCRLYVNCIPWNQN